MIWRQVKKHPFVIMLLLGLALGEIGSSLGILYDSGGVESLLFWLPLLLTFPMWIAHEVLSSFHFLHGIYFSKWVAVAFGFVIAFGLDYLFTRVTAAVRRNSRAAA